MPRREDIERFAQVLNSLGDEPAIRAARSETIEEVPQPGEAAGEAAGAESLPLQEGEPGALGLEAEPGAEAESLQDIFQSLSALPEEGSSTEEGEGLEQGGAPEAGAPEAGAPEAGGAQRAGPAAGPAAAEESEGLDFESLFGEETAPGGIEDLAAPTYPADSAPTRPAGSARKPPAAAAQPAEEPASEEAFSLPEGAAEALGADLSALETLPEETEQAEGGLEPSPAPGTEGGEGAEGEPFGDLGSFDLPEEPGAETTGEAPGQEAADLGGPAAGGEPGAAESFDLPNLDDLTFSGPSAPAEPPEPSFESPEPGGEPPIDTAFQGPSTPTEPSGEPSFEAPEEPSAEEPAPSFDLDTATFGESLGEAAGSEEIAGEMPTEMPGGGFSSAEPGVEGVEAGAGLEGLGDESLGNLDLDEFSLPESAEQFGMQGVPSTEPPAAPEPVAAPRPRAAERRGRPAPRAPEAPVEELGGGELPAGDTELTPEQFARLKSTLAALPRNLKIAVQDLIGQGMVSGADLSALLGLLVRGASAQEIATLAGRISGKRIRVPAGYEKRSGLEFEAEQRTFSYAFRENFLPLLRVVAITVLVGALFGFLGYNYVYRPLFAWTNYRAGYSQIANDRFTLANERFARATSVWPLKQWYYRYAEAFAGKRNYPLAEGKYDELLKSWPLDKKGILDCARLESNVLADYQKADALLKQYLDVHPKDYDALLASGDNYLAWAERTPAKYEAARLAYATLIQDYGARDDLLFRMLRYFIRTDNGEEVERLRAYYFARPDVKVDASAFAELGGYLVDHRRMDFVQEVLFRADKAQANLYEVHYNLARYYRLVQDYVDEKKALDATQKILDLTRSTAPLTPRRLNVEIDNHTRLGEYYYRVEQYIPAERELQDAIRLVETYQQQKIIDRSPLYGRPYAVLGDLAYYIEDNLSAAAAQYQAAAANLYSSPLLTYKIGYVQYYQGDFKDALGTFSSAEDASAYPSIAQDFAPAVGSSPPAPAPAPAGARRNPAAPQRHPSRHRWRNRSRLAPGSPRRTCSTPWGTRSTREATTSRPRLRS